MTRRWRFLGIVLLVIVSLFALLQPTGAQQSSARQPFWAQGSAARAGGAARIKFTDDGYLRAAGAPDGQSFSSGVARSAAPEDVAKGFLRAQARWFFDASPAVEFRASRARESKGRSHVRLDQTYAGIQVFGSAVSVQVRGAGVEFLLSDLMRDFSRFDSGAVSTTPVLSAQEVRERALAWVEKHSGPGPVDVIGPELVIYDPGVVGNDGPSVLAWNVKVSDVTRPLGESLFFDAATGKLVFHYATIEEALNRQIYSAEHTAGLGFLRRAEGGPVTGVLDVDRAYDYYGHTYNFYSFVNGRDSIDNAGMPLQATVRFCPSVAECPFQNAFWDPDSFRMFFGDGFTVDDVVGHELTHGVTQFESNLIYYGQSGAINESFSDMWGEWIDQTNGAGNDLPGVKWLMGEELPGIGAIRDMQDPTNFGDPDRMGSPNWLTGAFDNGGVHINSGVGNKLCYLLTDGDTFNGYTITPLGLGATAQLFYEAQTNLLGPGSDYFDLYDAITQAAINLGFSPAQKASVEAASRAVEIRTFASATGFQAATHSGLARVDLSWKNPLDPTFTQVRIRRDSVGFPEDPNSGGTLVYEGNGTSFSDTGVVNGTPYYYSIWAYHGSSDRSFARYAAAQAGLVQNSPSEYFLGDLDDQLDLDNRSLTFTPRGAAGYTLCTQDAIAFPVDPAGGAVLALDDDAFVQIALNNGAQVPLFGTPYSSVFVSSNGRITFGAGSLQYSPDFLTHFAIPSVAALFTDLDVSAGGQIRAQQLDDREVVSFINVPEFGVGGSNNIQMELFFNGTLRITYLSLDAVAGLAGVSAGIGAPSGFVETNMDESNGGDFDSDLLFDCWELSFGLNPNSNTGNNGGSGDPDSDGLSNLAEQTAGTNPNDNDSDDDTLLDGWEVSQDLNPNSATGADGAAGDPDGDGLSNAQEQGSGTNPRDADTDDDGLSDRQELIDFSTSPTNPDSDGDGDSDGEEIASGTNPNANDSIAGPGGAIPDLATLNFQVTVPASSPAKQILDLDVSIRINHTFTEDLTVRLTSPQGTQVLLVAGEGGPGDNFNNTRFDDEAAASIVKASAPFTGRYRPEVPLSALDGQGLSGVWTLTVQDSAAGDSGTLVSWTLHPKPRRDLVFVNFAAAPGGTGTSFSPYNSLPSALAVAAYGGVINVQGTSPAPITLNQATRLEASGGTVRIGAP